MGRNMKHHTKCKFCGADCEVEQHEDCPDDWAEKLLAMVACNRCADFRTNLSTHGADVHKACANYIQVLNSNKGTTEKEQQMRRTLEILTRRIADTACRFYRLKPVVWDPDFVQQIMERPDKSWAIISTYIRMVAAEARKPKPAVQEEIVI